MKQNINAIMRMLASKLDEEEDDMEDEEDESNVKDYSKDEKLKKVMGKKYKGGDKSMKDLMDKKRKAVILLMIKNKRNEARS